MRRTAHQGHDRHEADGGRRREHAKGHGGMNSPMVTEARKADAQLRNSAHAEAEVHIQRLTQEAQNLRKKAEDDVLEKMSGPPTLQP